MPFIEDDLLWSPPETENKMVDLSQCLDGGGGLGELSQTDLTGLVSGIDEEEDIFKQLDSSFELEQFFDFYEEGKEENNNSLIGGSNKNSATVALLQELQRSQANARKFNIAAANPLLAGCLQFGKKTAASLLKRMENDIRQPAPCIVCGYCYREIGCPWTDGDGSAVSEDQN